MAMIDLGADSNFIYPVEALAQIFRLQGSSRTIDRRSNVAQPAITITMIVPHIVFTMLATGYAGV